MMELVILTVIYIDKQAAILRASSLKKNLSQQQFGGHFLTFLY